MISGEVVRDGGVINIERHITAADVDTATLTAFNIRLIIFIRK